jgi:hypothetical protein
VHEPQFDFRGTQIAAGSVRHSININSSGGFGNAGYTGSTGRTSIGFGLEAQALKVAQILAARTIGNLFMAILDFLDGLFVAAFRFSLGGFVSSAV